VAICYEITTYYYYYYYYYLKGSKFMARRFASSTEQEIEKLLKQIDLENKRRLTKIAKELLHEYLKEKSVQKLEDKKDTNVEIVCRYFVYL